MPGARFAHAFHFNAVPLPRMPASRSPQPPSFGKGCSLDEACDCANASLAGSAVDAGDGPGQHRCGCGLRVSICPPFRRPPASPEWRRQAGSSRRVAHAAPAALTSSADDTIKDPRRSRAAVLRRVGDIAASTPRRTAAKRMGRRASTGRYVGCLRLVKPHALARAGAGPVPPALFSCRCRTSSLRRPLRPWPPRALRACARPSRPVVSSWRFRADVFRRNSWALPSGCLPCVRWGAQCNRCVPGWWRALRTGHAHRVACPGPGVRPCRASAYGLR